MPFPEAKHYFQARFDFRVGDLPSYKGVPIAQAIVHTGAELYPEGKSVDGGQLLRVPTLCNAQLWFTEEQRLTYLKEYVQPYIQH